MQRTSWLWVGVLVVTVSGLTRADEPVPYQPFVNLDVRVIELHGKVRLPIPPRKDSVRRPNERPLLTADQLTTVRKTWKSEPDARMLAAARLRIKLGAQGQFRHGREIPVPVKSSPSDQVGDSPAQEIRKDFCGTVIDATFHSVSLESIGITIAIDHSTHDDNEFVGGSRMSTMLQLEAGKTFMLPLGKSEKLTAFPVPLLSKIPRLGSSHFTRQELEEHGLVVLITPVLEAADEQ